ncbi:MAG: Ldh family oxidoreductase [Chloroflexi bacterium]|nr:Ldh family oxidoreductase [Chloroflexota bacterium]
MSAPSIPRSRTMVDADRLETLVGRIFESFGMPAEDARSTARGLVAADLRGHESHGVSNYLDVYYQPGLESGLINPRPQPRILHETETTARWDGDGGIGFVVAEMAMRDAIERARRHGVGFAAVANSRHYGMAQLYSRMAVDHGMIGISMTNGGALAVPFGGADPRLGTNPISVAVPCGEEPPFVLDMATTAAAMGKVLNAHRDGASIPTEWALGTSGVPTSDPQDAMDAARLLPLGSSATGGAHKGYGLAVVVEILSGVLSGTGFGQMLGPDNLGHFLGAIRVDAFIPLAGFTAMMDALVRELRATPPAQGSSGVLVAGDPEHIAEADRRANGVPLHPRVVEMLRGYAERLEVPFDLVR